MRSRIRSLERELLADRVVLTLSALALKFFHDWRTAKERGWRLPDEVDLIEAVHGAGLDPPTLPRAAGYLDRCLRNDEEPDCGKLKSILLAWDFESHPK